MKSLKILLAALSAVAVAGCGDKMSDDGLPDKDRQAATRLDEIVKKSGGDWEKIPKADQEYIVKEISMGSETSAKKLVQGKAGHFSAKPGGK
ncbi:MAG: hypothetical protein ACO1SV_01810 [Fimbriimonas sp.]